ncbi:MAG: hypothetical protein ACI8UD_002377, partial [Planctomycetota bacterium]
RALDGVTPARYVAGIVQLARALSDNETWATMAALIKRMAAVRIARENSLITPQL